MIRVFLVDDHPSTRSGIRRALEAAGGFDVVGEAADGNAALEAIQNVLPDVVVLDINLPGLSGPEVARALAGGPTRVLAFSAHAGRGYARALLEAGAEGYLTKDAPESDVIAGVRAVASGRGWWHVVPHDPDDPVSLLSERERDALSLLARGLSNADIAQTLMIAEGTVRNTLTVVYQKIGVETSREAAVWAWTHGLGPPSP